MRERFFFKKADHSCSRRRLHYSARLAIIISQFFLRLFFHTSFSFLILITTAHTHTRVPSSTTHQHCCCTDLVDTPVGFLRFDCLPLLLLLLLLRLWLFFSHHAKFISYHGLTNNNKNNAYKQDYYSFWSIAELLDR
jgi:hypothetical protein